MLQLLWRQLVNTLDAAGLLAREEQKADLAGNLKVHATVANSRWRKASRGSHGGGGGGAFDARALMSTHGDFDFGSQQIHELQISRLSAAPTKGGYRLDAQGGWLLCWLHVRVLSK